MKLLESLFADTMTLMLKEPRLEEPKATEIKTAMLKARAQLAEGVMGRRAIVMEIAEVRRLRQMYSNEGQQSQLHNSKVSDLVQKESELAFEFIQMVKRDLAIVKAISNYILTEVSI